MLRTVNGGFNWTLCYSAKEAAGSLNLYGIHMVQPKIVYAVGEAFNFYRIVSGDITLFIVTVTMVRFDGVAMYFESALWWLKSR